MPTDGQDNVGMVASSMARYGADWYNGAMIAKIQRDARRNHDERMNAQMPTDNPASDILAIADRIDLFASSFPTDHIDDDTGLTVTDLRTAARELRDKAGIVRVKGVE